MRIRTFSICRFTTDQSGVAAVEFAIILPLMLMMYLGSYEITQAISVKRMTTIAASTVANIVTQYPSLSASNDIPDILNAASAVLTPYPVANATITVTLITIDANKKATVAWSKALNGSGYTAGTAMNIPAALQIPNSSLVFGEATYKYTPLFNYFEMGTVNLYESVYMLPRDQSGTINLTP